MAAASPAQGQYINYSSGDELTSSLNIDAGSLTLMIDYSLTDPQPAVEKGSAAGSGTLAFTSNGGGALQMRGNNTAFTGVITLDSGGYNVADNSNLIRNMGNIRFAVTDNTDQVNIAAGNLRSGLAAITSAAGQNQSSFLGSFISATYDSVTTGEMGYLQINNNADIRVIGGALDQRLITSNSRSGRIQALNDATLSYSGHNSANGGGAGIVGVYNNSSLELAAGLNTRFIFDNNRAGFGGAVEAINSLFKANQVDFTNNRALGVGSSGSNGGAINLIESSLVLDDARFEANSGTGFGGAIDNGSGDIWVDNGLFTGNTSDQRQGGAIANRNSLSRASLALIQNSRFTGNRTLAQGGGAIANLQSTLLMDNVTFSNNGAQAHSGGALYNSAGRVLMSAAAFTGNTAALNGGAIYNNNQGGAATDILDLSNVSFTSNQAGQQGGAIYSQASTINLNVSGGATSSFSGNSAAGQANSFYLLGTGDKDSVLNINVAAGATLDMLDPISGQAGNAALGSRNILIEKTGAGQWNLGGFSQIANANQSGANIIFRSAGNLHLYGANEKANGAGQVTAGVLSLEGAGSLIEFADNSTLTMGGQNGLYISGNSGSPLSGTPQGRINFVNDATLGFDLSRQSIGETSLEMKAANITVGGQLNIDILAIGQKGRYVLVHKNADAAGVDFLTPGVIHPTLSYRGRVLGGANSRAASGFVVVVEDKDTVVLVNNFENQVLSWTNSGADWEMDKGGWVQTSDGTLQRYFDGDVVNFDSRSGSSGLVTVETDGFITAGIYVSGPNDYIIQGDTLTASATATTLTGASGKLVLGQRATGDAGGNVTVSDLLYTGTLDLSSQAGTNNFLSGLDVYSGSLRISGLKQIGGNVGVLSLLSNNSLWNSTGLALNSYAAAPEAANLANLGTALNSDRLNGLATLKIMTGGDFSIAGQRLTVAADRGGSISLEDANPSLTWRGNNVAANGGAVAVGSNALLALSGAAGGKYIFTGNRTTGAGGAVYNQGAFIGLGSGPETYAFTGNTADTRGGAIANDGVMLIDQALFNRNRSLGDGGAIHNTGVLALTDFRFQNNVTGSSGRGGAIYNSGQLSLIVSDNNTNAYFGSNRTDLGLNSVYLQSGAGQAGLNLAVGHNASLWMYDPLGGQAGASDIVINKTGAGLWGLAGDINFQSGGTGGTVMNINEGILHLARSGGIGGFRVDTANISLAGAASAFNLNSGATLQVGGVNRLTSDGAINFNQGAAVAMESGRQGILTFNRANLNGQVDFQVANSTDRLALEGVLTGAGDLLKTGAGALILAYTGHRMNFLDVQTGTLGLIASTDEVAVTTNMVNFAPGSTLDISGFNGSQYGQAVDLIKSRDDINIALGQPNVTIAQNAAVDFLSTQVRVTDDKKILQAIIDLAWYDPNQSSPGTYDRAHGTFTLDNASGGFKLDAVLSDRSGNFATPGKPWDGKSLTKRGQGLLILGGDNDYSGQTTIEGGTLSITGLTGTGLNQADKLVDIQAAGTLEINTADSGDYHKKLIGGGGLTKAGGGNVTLTNVNSGFSGLISVLDGALTAVNERSFGAGAVVDSALVNLVYDGLFQNDLSGGGNLDTYGQLTLTGRHAGHDGLLRVRAGRLTLGGPGFASGAWAQVDRAAVLAGEGTVGGLLVRNGGTASPGNSLGVINISGDLQFEAGGMYRVELDLANGRSDLLRVGGMTTINPQALLRTSIMNTRGLARGESTRFKIIADDAFADDTLFAYTNRLGWTFSQILENDGLYLVLTHGSGGGGENGNGGGGGGAGDLICPAGSPNACSVGGAYDEIVDKGKEDQLGDLGDTLADLDLGDPGHIIDSFMQLTGELHPSLSGALQQNDRALAGQLRGRLEPAEEGWPLWITIGGLNQRGRSSRYYASGRLEGMEAILGTAASPGEGWMLGGALRLHDYDYDYRSDSGDIKGLIGAIFAEKTLRTWGISRPRLYFGASYSHHDIKTKRRIAIVATDRSFFSRPEADYDINNLQLFGELGYAMSLGENLEVEPYLGFNWSTLKREAFTEKSGREANLKADKLTEDRAASELGLRLGGRPAENLRLRASFAWRHMYGDVNHHDRFSFAAVPEVTFGIDGAPQSRDEALIGLRADYDLSPASAFKLEYNGSLGDNSYGHNGNLTFIHRF